jgi:hypothetical protein
VLHVLQLNNKRYCKRINDAYISCCDSQGACITGPQYPLVPQAVLLLLHNTKSYSSIHVLTRIKQTDTTTFWMLHDGNTDRFSSQ